MKKPFFIIGIVILLVIVGLIVSNRNVSAPSSETISGQATNQPITGITPSSTTETAQPAIATITFTDAGYSPKSLTITNGDTVTFKNMSSKNTWPASGMHPTHTQYPTTGGCLGSTFDACRGLGPGESWSFTFTKVGSWSYHDHLSPSFFGKVVVQ